MPFQPKVEIDSLTHCYGRRAALDDVSFDVSPGCIFGLLGPNGGGKTTLFKILATLLTPTRGAARIGGANVVTDRSTVRRCIGVVFQQPSLDRKLTVLENIRHQGHMYGLSGVELLRRGRTLLERFAVADRAGDLVETLSGGLQRRVELAKALLHRPGVLILDEPSTGLDPGARLTLMNHLRELRDREGVTVLLTTHLMEEADDCDRVAVLDNGRLSAIDTPAALKRIVGGEVLTLTTREPITLARKVSQTLRVSAEVADGAVRIEHERGHEFVTDLIETFPGEIDRVTVGKPTLEDVFVHLTGHGLSDDRCDASEGDGRE